MTVGHVYNLAEAYRLYNCDSLKSIPEQVDSVFKNEVERMTKPSNLHYAFILNEQGSGKTKDNKAISQRIKNHLLPNFNQTDFGFEGTNGLSVDSLKVLDIFSGSKDAENVAATYIQKISKQAVSTGEKYAFVSQFANGKQLSAVNLNYYTVQIMKRLNNLAGLSNENRVGLRNYFTQQAALSTSVSTLLPSLKGLRILDGAAIPAVRLAASQKKQVALKDKAVKFEVVDSYGNPLKGLTLSKVSIGDLSDNKAGLKDITSSVKLDSSVATWNADTTKVGRYQLVFTFETFTVSSPLVTVVDKLVISSVQYSVEKSSTFPSRFDGKVEFPNKASTIKQLSDDYFLHVAVQAGFVKSTSERPAQVFLSLKKKVVAGAAQNVAINSYGKLNKDTGLYEITVNVNKDIGVQLNGDYDLTVQAGDYRAEAPLVWQLGSVKVWYKEGHEEGTNTGIKTDFQPLPTIHFVYPEEKSQISLLVSNPFS